MHPTPTLLALLVLLLPLASLASAQTPEPVVEIYDPGGLSWFRQRTHRVFMTMPLAASSVGPAGETSGREAWGEDVDRVVLGDGQFERMVCDLVGPDAVRDARIEVLGEHFWVSAPPDLQPRIGVALESLLAALSASVLLELHTLPPAALRAAPAKVLSGAQVDALLEQHSPLATVRAPARLGRGARLISARRRSLVTEFDVEVAQEMFSGDPLVKQLLLGLEVGVRVHAASAGRLLMIVGGRHMELLGEVRELSTGSARVLPGVKDPYTVKTGTLQLPRSRSTVTRGSAVVTDGGGLLVGHDGSSGGLWLVRATRRRPQMTWKVGGSDLLALAELLTPPVVGGWPTVGPPNPSGFGSGVGGFDDDDTEKPEAFIDVNRIEGWLMRDADTEPDRPPFIHALGDYVLSGGPEAVRKRIRESTLAWSRRFARTVELDVRIGAVPPGTPTSPADAARLASVLPLAAGTAGREGDDAAVIGGEEEAILKDHDIEIAQGATGPDPVVDSVFTGFHVGGRLDVAPGGDVVMRGRVFWQERVHPTRQYALESGGFGDLDQVDLAHVQMRDLWTLKPGQWTLLAFAPVEGTGHAMACVVRARVR